VTTTSLQLSSLSRVHGSLPSGRTERHVWLHTC